MPKTGLRFKCVEGALLPYRRRKCPECGARFDQLPDWKYRRREKYFCSWGCTVSELRRFEAQRMEELAVKVADRLLKRNGSQLFRSYELCPGLWQKDGGMTPEQEEQVLQMARRINEEREAAHG